MTGLKKIMSGGMILYSLFIGFFIVLMTTNNYFLFIIEKAVEMELDPFCFRQWILVLLWS